MNQLRVVEGQETKSRSDLIRDKNWLPFPVLVELTASHQYRLCRAVCRGESKAEFSGELTVLLWEKSTLPYFELRSAQAL